MDPGVQGGGGLEIYKVKYLQKGKIYFSFLIGHPLRKNRFSAPDYILFSDPEKLTAFRIWNENDPNKSRVLYVKLKCSKTYETIMGAIVERKPGEDICIQFNTEGSHECSMFLYTLSLINKQPSISNFFETSQPLRKIKQLTIFLVEK